MIQLTVIKGDGGYVVQDAPTGLCSIAKDFPKLVEILAAICHENFKIEIKREVG